MPAKRSSTSWEVNALFCITAHCNTHTALIASLSKQDHVMIPVLWQELWAGETNHNALNKSLICEAGQLHVHQRLGLAVVQHVASGHWDAVQNTPIGRLSASDAAAARRLLTVGVLRIERAGVRSAGAVETLHSSLQFWAGQGTRYASLHKSWWSIIAKGSWICITGN